MPSEKSGASGSRPVRTLTLALLIVAAGVSLIFAGSLYAEARYAFESSKPVELGAFATADLSQAIAGRYVRAEVNLDGKESVAFRRIGESEHRIAMAASVLPPGSSGSPLAPRFVEHSVPSGLEGRFVPPKLVAGRLSRVGELGLRYRGLSMPLEALAANAATQGWVLTDGEDPKSAAWIAGLEVVLVIFFLERYFDF